MAVLNSPEMFDQKRDQRVLFLNAGISLLVEAAPPFSGLTQSDMSEIRLRKNLQMGRYKGWFFEVIG